MIIFPIGMYGSSGPELVDLNYFPSFYSSMNQPSGGLVVNECLVGETPISDMVVYGSPTFEVPGKVGDAIDFGGDSSCGTSGGQAPPVAGGMVFSAWIKTSTPNLAILGWGRDSGTHEKIAQLIVQVNGRLRLQINGFVGPQTYTYGTIDVANGLWHHILVQYQRTGPSFDDRIVEFWVNGVLDKHQEFASSTFGFTNQRIYLAQYESDSGLNNGQFDGVMDEVAIWRGVNGGDEATRFMSEDQVLTLYNIGLAGTTIKDYMGF